MSGGIKEHVGWHPAPNGEPALWYWDGDRWADPVAQTEQLIAQLITPHLENAFTEGMGVIVSKLRGTIEALADELAFAEETLEGKTDAMDHEALYALATAAREVIERWA